MPADLRILAAVFKLQGVGKDPFDKNALVLQKPEMLNEKLLDEMLAISYPEIAPQSMMASKAVIPMT